MTEAARRIDEAAKDYEALRRKHRANPNGADLFRRYLLAKERLADAVADNWPAVVADLEREGAK